MKAKIDLEKFICSMLNDSKTNAGYVHTKSIERALKEQGMEYKDGKIVEIEQESEDEKIRKELIEHIKANCETGFILFQKFSPDDILAWLEKQGEQKVSTVDWKPSDEQMKLLEELIEDNDQRHFHTLLKSLYEQLKRLKEE